LEEQNGREFKKYLRLVPYMAECSKCGAKLVSEEKIKAYAFHHQGDAAYHWAVGVHTFINNDQPPCSHCDLLYSFFKQ